MNIESTTSRAQPVRRLRQSAGLLESLERRLLWSGGSVSIDGVQPAALDQPQIHGLLTTTTGGSPLMGQDMLGDPTYDIQGFLDTGTSGILLSSDTASSFGVAETTYKGTPVDYSDSGVAGTEAFGVSSPLNVSLAAFNANNDTNSGGSPPAVTDYTQTAAGVRLQISRQPVDPLVGPLNIFGMPTLQKKVMVMDPTPVNSSSSMSTYVYNPGTPYNAAAKDTNPGIPSTNFKVKLSYASFNQFTTVTPAGAPGPIEVANPFIGPNPVLKLTPGSPVDNTPPVSLGEGAATTTGSFLFDTGAAASFMSTAEASNLGIHYKAGTYNTANPELVDARGNAVPNQFVLPIGGIGGTLNAAGFFVDSLTLPTTSGVGVKFVHAPVLVADISVTDPKTHKTLTLDGDFGMNFLVASTDATLSKESAGAFDWVTFDQPNGLLGLDLPGAVVTPPPTAAATLPALTVGGGTTYTFTVKYTAPPKQTINIASINGGNIKVTGPNGYNKLATLVSTSSKTNSATITATYRFSPADVYFDAADNGAYTATLLASQVTDTNGDAAVSTALGTIKVNLPHAVLTGAGQLIVDGTSGSDSIALSASKGTVIARIDNITQSFTASAVKSITINSFAGNDTITVGSGLASALIHLGSGNNTVFARNGKKDTIVGGVGNDVATVDLIDVVTNVKTIKH